MGGQVSPADTSFAVIMLWIAGLGTLLSVGTAVWTIFSGPSKKNASRLDEHGKRLDDHELRISRVEQSQAALPTASNMHELEIAMTRLQGEIKTMSAVMEGQSAIMMRLESIVSRHDTHLLEGNRTR